VIGQQQLTCHDCGHAWQRLLLLVNGGVTDGALECPPCPRCGRECDPWLDGETPRPIAEWAQVAA
jgi:hypothetical protein